MLRAQMASGPAPRGGGRSPERSTAPQRPERSDRGSTAPETASAAQAVGDVAGTDAPKRRSTRAKAPAADAISTTAEAKPKRATAATTRSRAAKSPAGSPTPLRRRPRSPSGPPPPNDASQGRARRGCSRRGRRGRQAEAPDDPGEGRRRLLSGLGTVDRVGARRPRGHPGCLAPVVAASRPPGAGDRMNAALTRGQPAALAAAETMLRGGFPHAVLLVGPPSIGKTTLALDIAAALLCVDPDPAARPCRSCRACRLVAGDRHPDLHRLGPGGAGDQVKLEATPQDPRPGVRDLVADLALSSVEGGARVALVERAHRMNEDAQNALLKTLEEPAPGVHLILCADDEDRLLPTIRSRCARIRLGTVAPGRSRHGSPSAASRTRPRPPGWLGSPRDGRGSPSPSGVPGGDRRPVRGRPDAARPALGQGRRAPGGAETVARRGGRPDDGLVRRGPEVVAVAVVAAPTGDEGGEAAGGASADDPEAEAGPAGEDAGGGAAPGGARPHRGVAGADRRPRPGHRQATFVGSTTRRCSRRSRRRPATGGGPDRLVPRPPRSCGSRRRAVGEPRARGRCPPRRLAARRSGLMVDPALDPVRLEAVVRGRVQGVGFRYFVAEKAVERGIVGWVANELDGSVACVVEGPRREPGNRSSSTSVAVPSVPASTASGRPGVRPPGGSTTSGSGPAPTAATDAPGAPGRRVTGAMRCQFRVRRSPLAEWRLRPRVPVEHGPTNHRQVPVAGDGLSGLHRPLSRPYFGFPRKGRRIPPRRKAGRLFRLLAVGRTCGAFPQPWRRAGGFSGRLHAANSTAIAAGR